MSIVVDETPLVETPITENQEIEQVQADTIQEDTQLEEPLIMLSLIKSGTVVVPGLSSVYA